jgi:2-amino-4-hydroxy-6-hydroxymethyldihydropteridine diphosphokinase
MIVLALGTNLSGVWGTPVETLQRALNELTRLGIQTISVSKTYYTRAHSIVSQPDYLNAVTVITTPMSALALLQVLKRIEAQAGRRRKAKDWHLSHQQWLPRTLDLDIVSYHGVICNWKVTKPRGAGCVVLPHPRAHQRAFVLRPLADAAPGWHHPVFGLTAGELLKFPGVSRTGMILRPGEPLRIPKASSL